MGEIRGKIWITRSYGNDIAGSYALYGTEGVTDNSVMYMQNMYNVFTTNRGEKVRLVMETAKRGCDSGRLKANFLSGSGGVFPYWLARIDGGTN